MPSRLPQRAMDGVRCPMTSDRLDYGIERQRHAGFLGREAVLAKLDQLLVEGEADRWGVVTGGPGVGKSAILAAWLSRREAAGAVVPHHFIRRGEGGWDEPAKIMASLAAQIEACYPAQRDPDARPESRLVDLLARVSARELAPRAGHLVLLVDGLDEYDAPTGTYNPLAAFLPQALPRVRLLCASRPRHPYLQALEARAGVLTRIDLDDPSAAGDNEATVRAFWRGEAAALGLDERFIDEAVASADGNMQHAVTLRKHLAGVPHAQRRVEAIPRGLKALLTLLWRRVANSPVATRGLGILCAAREPLSLDELGAAAGWGDVAQREAFAHVALEFLVETQRKDSVAAYRLHHDSIRAHVMEQLGPAAMRGHHIALAQKLATWPTPSDATARRYALRHALAHRVEAGDWASVGQLALDLGYLEARCHEFGAHDVEVDVARAAKRCCEDGDAVLAGDLGDLGRALARESHWLRNEPGVLSAQLWNRLRRMGWSKEDLDERIRLPGNVEAFMRVRRVISRESPALLRDLIGHTGEVHACAVTPDGSRVISASGDKTLKVWDLETGRVVMTLEGHVLGVMSCAVTGDSSRVVSTSADRTLKVWDLETGRVLRALEGHTDWVLGCAVTSDGQCVVSTSADRTLKVWDLETGRVLRTLEGHTGWVMSCAVTADCQRVVSASADRTLRIWEFETGRMLGTLEGHTSWVNSCAVVADGQRVVSASGDKTFKIWDLATGHVLKSVEAHSAGVYGCAVSLDGHCLVTASSDKTLKVWDLETGYLRTPLEGHADWVNSCALTFDGSRAVSASGDKILKVWNLERSGVRGTREGHADWVNGCTVTCDGRRGVSASGDKTLKVWDLETGRLLKTLEGHTDEVRSCGITSDDRYVVSASCDKTLRVWDLETGGMVRTLEGHTGWVNSCLVVPDSQRVVSASDDQVLKVWDLEDGRVLATLEGHTKWVNSCVTTHDGRVVVSASSDKTLKIWDPEAWRVVRTLEGHTGMVHSCAVTSDGRVVSASSDKTLRVWDRETGRLLATLEGHTGTVNSCVVTPDSQFVVSASHDRTLKIWDLATYRCLATHRGDAKYHAVAATRTAICAGDAAGTLWILEWPLSLTSSRVLTPPAKPSLSAVAPNDPRTRRSGIGRNLILFLAANPSATSRLALDEECAAIERELHMTLHRDDFEFRSKWAVSVDEMMRHLNELPPTVIHFSGHGAGSQLAPARSSPASRDIVASSAGGRVSGIYLQDERGEPQLVTARALTMMIKSAASSARVVLLNACYSDLQASALCSVVDCVIGMTGAIRDDAARSFAVGFYRALGNRRSVGNAVDQAIAILAAKQLPDEQLPRCRTRDGIDAHQLLLGVSG